MDKKVYYLDNAATTFVAPSVIKVISSALENSAYNPSSVYKPAVDVRAKINLAKKQMLNMLGTDRYNIIFTGSATEANNTALLKIKNRKNFVALIGGTEHPAVFEMAEKLRKMGAEIFYIPVDQFGFIDEDEYIKLLNEKPVKFVSIMHVNNENGAINDIEHLCELAKEKDENIVFHSDGVQAFGKINVDLETLNVDMYTISAHKINGPKGIGALVYKKDVLVEPFIVGGGQEEGLRSGTENVPYILGFAEAVKLRVENLDKNLIFVQKQKEKFITLLKNKGVDFELYSNDSCSPYILQIRFPKVRGEVLLHALEKYNIYISTGSACSSKKKTNRVLEAMGKTYAEEQEVVRISFGLVDEDLEFITDMIVKETKSLRIR